MQLSAATRTITLNAREFAEFTTGPSGGGFARPDPLRAQIGQTWHDELRGRTAASDPAARFEVPLAAAFPFRGWEIRLSGRIDQVVTADGRTVVHEVKTVMRPLPAAEDDLLAEHPGHFLQLAVYQCLHAAGGAPGEAGAVAGAVVFVEPPTGIVQVVPQSAEVAWSRFQARLDELWAFAEQRRAGLERLRALRFTPAFTTPRPGQETVLEELRAAAARSPIVLFEAPTGFGKTGCVLEYALRELADGRLTRLVYLTGKSTGQLEVVRQLEAMVGHPPGATWWRLRNKGEHCINDVHHCFREACRFLDGQEERWPSSGLQRFGHDPALPRDLETLREAGRRTLICPYEITRASLPFTDVWIADYNYVFAPDNRSFLGDLAGFEPAHTLLVIDEAHNLPARVADAHSSELTHEAARLALAALDFAHAPAALVAAWERLTVFLGRLDAAEELDPDVEAELRDLFAAIERRLAGSALDHPALGPVASGTLFQVARLHATAAAGGPEAPELIWAPAPGVVRFTRLDAATAIAGVLRDFGHVVFLSATLAPLDAFARHCGLDGLPVEPARLRAHAPWRDGAYDVVVDARVDTRYQRRAAHHGDTARTIARLHAAGNGPVAVFFSSHAYAGAIARTLEDEHPVLRVALQPRAREVASQAGFIEDALAFADVLLLVLGGSFAEGIDLLGGRVAGAIVVGPALPEVNPVQRARLAASRAPGREAAFREVYQIPGMHKVNQALGRLVRAPGQRARVVLHCRRFAELSYQRLLAPEYQTAPTVASDAEFDRWLAGG